MRCVYFAAAVLVAGGLAVSAVASECAPCGQGMPTRGMQCGLCAPACAGPGYGMLTPGCCQCQPNCCTNAWDGYCQEQARRRCYRRLFATSPSRPGYATASDCGPNGVGVSGEQVMLEPTPAATAPKTPPKAPKTPMPPPPAPT